MTIPTRQLRRGFTLIELLLVCATIAIVTAMAVPRYGQALSNYRVRCAAQRVAVDLAAAAGGALASSSSRTVRFDLKTNTYQVDAGETVRLADEPYGAALESADLGGDDAIVFDGYGAPDGGGTIVLRSGDATRTVTVDPVTGKASVK
jgi:prepilin-type N-terminal cleavage/methylation domain-containing protein